jgi:peroxiredoxin
MIPVQSEVASMTRATRLSVVLTLVLGGIAIVSVSERPARARQTQAPAAPKPPTEDIGFGPVEPWTLTVADLSQAQVGDLLSTLDRLLARQSDPAKWRTEVGLHFWRFQNRIERGRTTDAERATIAAHFDAIAAAHPADREYVDRRKWLALNVGVGRAVPDITGKDLDGASFSLSEYRGKIVYLIFTGEWCGPCRSEYPYQRLMLELYKGKPFALLGVNSDAKVETARQGKVDARLPYRSWWDGFEKKSTEGPIATAWGVTGWPTTYLIDAKGTIRFAGARHEDSLKAVAQLMDELPHQK